MNESKNLPQQSGSTQEKIQIVVDVALFAILVQIYAVSTKKDFAYSLGQVAVLALFGMGLYRLIDRFIMKGKVASSQRKFRQYVIGAYLISILSLPLLVSQANAEQKQDDIKFQIAHHAGEIHMSCEVSMHIKTKFCPDLKLAEEMVKLCREGVASISPVSFRSELQSVLGSQKTVNEVKAYQEQIDRNIAYAKTQPGYSDALLCKGYEDLLNKTVREGNEKIFNLAKQFSR